MGSGVGISEDTRLIVEVAEVSVETPSIKNLTLRKLDGSPFTPFTAGAHIDVVGPTGILRQYSLASDPREAATISIAVKLEPESRGGSAALHSLGVGDRLKISKPRNVLAIQPEADRHLLVAGGVGITPLLSMSYELHSCGADFKLHYFVRAPEDLAFADLLERRAEFRDRVSLHVGVSRDERRRLYEAWLPRFTPNSHVYTCGPEGFMEQVAQAFREPLGDSHVHIEHFQAPEVVEGVNRPFKLVLSTGEQFEIPSGRSILSVLEENGQSVFKSCEEGICGSCIVTVLNGVPDHRDHCLSASEKATGKEIAICVSRAVTESLEIELY